MKRVILTAAVMGLVGVGVAAGQAHAGTPATAPPEKSAVVVPSGPAVEVQKYYAGVKANILKSAEKMPAESYSFKPEPDVRTYARVLNHITEVQVKICGVVNGTAAADLIKVPAETADKTEIVEALKASFAACDKAYATITDANLTEMFTTGPAKRSRVGLLWQNGAHDAEQYATLALYLRLKDIAPPSSEK